MADGREIKCEPQSSLEESQIWEQHVFYIKEDVQSDDDTDSLTEQPYLQETLDIKEEADNEEALPIVGDAKEHQSLNTSSWSLGTFCQDLSKNGHICNQCGKSFHTPSKLSRHALVHSGQRPYSCKYCGKTFQQNESLSHHILEHTEGRTRRHSCPVCGKTFGERSGLIRHEAVHSGKRTQCCPTCRKMFVQKSHLQRHMQTHSKTKDYKCSYCEKRFGDPSALAPHIRAHTGERPYTCGLCGMSFIQKCHLVRHIPRKHGPKKQKGKLPNTAR